MNDLSEIENELRKLRPARPSPILFERVEEAMADHCRGSAAADAVSGWRHFTEWSRGDASDIDGQLVTARKRERASQTPYKWGLGLAAAAVLVLFAAVSMERQHERGEKIAQVSPAPETRPVLPTSRDKSGIARSTFSNEFVPAGATRLVYNTRNEGLQFARGSGQPLRRFRYQTHETWQWRNPTTGASLRVSYPSEEVILIPVSGQ
jgi:hypothetical protein